jgi:large subunit ribosomal protein L15
VGRGRSAGQGKTAGRGTKGYLARNSKREGYEGGQMPLSRRVPKVQTQPSRTRPPRTVWAEVNVARLAQKFESGAVVSPDAMVQAGLVRKRRPVKVLGGGELDRPLTVQAHGFTRSARQKIEQAGGSIEVVGGAVEKPSPKAAKATPRASKPPAKESQEEAVEPAPATEEGAPPATPPEEGAAGPDASGE